MPSIYPSTFPASLLRGVVISTACLSFAFAQQDLPPSSTTTVLPLAGNRTLAVKPSRQGRRIALIIGNGDYQHSDNLPKLANPVNDAEDIAKALRGFGFEVIERKNQTLEGMDQAIAEFGSKIGGSEAALFYFAGHGIQVRNQNYLIPVNAKIESEAAVPYQGVDLNRILDEMENAKSNANIVMLDACRNNPITGKFRSGKSRGLASPASMPKGTVIVFATDPGNVAGDGDGRNGLFTAGLLTAFKGKDLSLDNVLTVASAEVERGSGQTQTPYVNGPKTLQKNFFFRVTVDPGRDEIETTFWTSIESSADPADFDAYLRKYPNGNYRALAENHIKRLLRSKVASASSVVTLDKTAAVAIPTAPVPISTPPIHNAPSKQNSSNSPEKVKLVAGAAFRDCDECPTMAVIPTGTYEMGSKEYASEKPMHLVKLNKPFALAKTEVTCEQWLAIMGKLPNGFASCASNLPVGGITWNEAQEYVQKLSEKSGKRYRLPSEAEWEYACRAGAPTEYCGSDTIDSVGWYVSPGGKVRAVAGKQPNAWGLHDMSGNVWEWTEDCWNPTYQGAPTDGSAWTSGDCSRRVRRGGSWDNNLRYLRATNRDFLNSALSGNDGGFRPARSLVP
jgi:formylglycine-generating enzyme required for sulfatase activity